MHANTLYKGEGCDQCGGSGYKGRCGFYEVMIMSTPRPEGDHERDGLTDELRELARSEGMLTLREDGLKKVEKRHHHARGSRERNHRRRLSTYA